ncbi:hypothetical protein IWX83_002586 [Flavobacterium sp. CG_9.1]|uniref:Uncharacterized protein n=1 Tax=Flavobacterium xanthum TaxID=69322 RepID=A0A1M6X9F3_9FLAO|nr:hypothetical protein [Flavobacterium sp. CG_9.1]SHL02591.1 hypothetical protein SAMN05443669_1001178 [Flavobacterium xanthum]
MIRFNISTVLRQYLADNELKMLTDSEQFPILFHH